MLTTDATKRNVNLTGTNAIYTKPGTVKGAKVVATTTTAKNLNKSTTSRENFRAYRVAKTNRGSIYYKVVSYNKVYRGWVYGGKSADTFAGGLTSYDTFKEGTLTADQKSGNYKLTNPGKTEAGLTYKQPAWTQYKIGKTIADTTAYKDATFSVDKVGTRTREGDTWVHVVNQNTADTKADGWILLSNLTQTNAFNEQSQVKVAVKDTDGNTIKEFNYTAPSAKGKDSVVTTDFYTGTGTSAAFTDAFQKQLDSVLNGTGYKAVATDSVNQSAVKTGSTYNLYAKKGDTVITGIKPYVAAGDGISGATPLVMKANATTEPLNLVVTASTTPTVPFSGVNGASYTADDVKANLTANKLITLTSEDYAKDKTDATKIVATTDPNAATDANGKVVVYHTVYTYSTAVAGNYVDSKTDATKKAVALYTASEKVGASTTTPTGDTNTGIFG